MDPFSLTLIGSFAALAGVAAYSFSICPNNAALIIYRGEKLTAKSIVRITKSSTWINPLKHRVKVLDLTSLVTNIAFKLPQFAGEDQTELYLHSQMTIAPQLDDHSLRLAALAGGSKEERRKKLTEIIEQIEISENMLGDSFENFCLIEESRAKCLLGAAIEESLAKNGHKLLAWMPSEISKDREKTLPGEEESSLSSALRTLGFKHLEMQVNSHSADLVRKCEFKHTWDVKLRPPCGIHDYTLACRHFLGTSTALADTIVSDEICRAIEKAVSQSGLEKWFSRVEKLFNIPSVSINSNTQGAIVLLNLLADVISTWRGKLTLTRLTLDGFLSIKKFDSEIDRLAIASMNSFGLICEKITLTAVDLKETSSAAKITVKDELIVDFDLPQTIEHEGTKEKILIKCQAHFQEEEGYQTLPTAELEVLFKEKLAESLTSAKIPHTVSLIKAVADKIERETTLLAGSEWDKRIEEHLRRTGPTTLILTAIRILFATFDAYQDVRKHFLEAVREELFQRKLTLNYFSIIDIQPEKIEA